MKQYLLRRLVISIPVLIGISMVTFAMVAFAPGDPVTAMINPESAGLLGPEWVEQQAGEVGPQRSHADSLRALDASRFCRATSAIRPPTGSRSPNKIGERIGPTLRLMGTALLISLVIAIPIGILSAIKQYSIARLPGDDPRVRRDLDPVVLPGARRASTSSRSSWAGCRSPGWTRSAGETPFGDLLQHLILPAFVLGLARRRR